MARKQTREEHAGQRSAHRQPKARPSTFEQRHSMGGPESGADMDKKQQTETDKRLASFGLTPPILWAGYIITITVIAVLIWVQS